MNIRFDNISYTLAHALSRIEDYCGIFVQGASMKDAGIQGGSLVVFKRHYEWVDGAIMLIVQDREGEKFSQMHRVRRINDNWYQCWEDGSGTKEILDESYYPHGLLVAVAKH
jgi:hypothetical protein